MPSRVLPTLSLGSHSSAVMNLQHYLNLLGADIDEDGLFGPETRQAVLTFQTQAGVTPQDGIVGPRTWEAIEVNLGISVGVDGSPGGSGPNPDHFPDADTGGGWFTPKKLAIGGVLLAGAAALLSKKSRSR